MRFMLLMHGTRATWEWLAAHERGAPLGQLRRQLHATGEWLGDGRLGAPEAARLVEARRGAPAVTATGAAARLLAYWLVDCESAARALQIAACVAAAAGPQVEVRPILRRPGEEM